MMRNIDIVAVAVLLFGIALFTHARRLVVFQVNQTHGIRFSPHGPYYRPMVIKPDVRPIPHMRD